MKLTVADLITDYYKRNPESISKNTLHEALSSEGHDLTKGAVCGGLRILIEKGYAAKDEDKAYCYKLIRLDYVSDTSKMVTSDATKKRNASKARKVAMKKLEESLRYRMICLSWNSILAKIGG